MESGVSAQHLLRLAVLGGSGLVALGAIAAYFWQVRREGRWLPKGGWQWASSAALACVALFGLSNVAQILQGRFRYDASVAAFESRRGQAVPPLAFQALDGTTQRLEDFRGQVVLVNLWATWCPPCVAELPALSKVQAQLGERGVKVVSISDETAEVVAAFAKRRGASHLLGTADLQAAGEPWSLVRHQRPITFLVDQEGRLQDAFIGVRDEAFFSEAAEKLLRP